MKGKLKALIGVSIGVPVLSFLIYWAGIAAPKKEVILQKEMVKDIDTNEVLPLYKVYYRWDRAEKKDIWWMIYKKKGQWKVIGVKEGNSIEEAVKLAVKFDDSWIDNYKFIPHPTRYQLILAILGFQPTYNDEKKVFFEILHQIKGLKK